MSERKKEGKKEKNGGKKGKILGIINIIDLLFLVVLVGVGFIVYQYLNQTTTSKNPVTIVFDVEFTNKEKGYIDSIEKDMLIQDSIRGGKYGVVEAISEYPDYRMLYDEKTESYVTAIIPDKYRVKLTVKGQGMESDKVIVTEDEVVKVGQQVFIKGKGFASEGFITDLEVQR